MADFTHGTKFMLDEKEYVVRKEDFESVEVMNLNYQKIETWSKNDLLAAWENKRLVFRISGDTKEQLKGNYIDLDMLPESLKQEALYRYSVLEPIINGTIPRNQIQTYASSLTPVVSVSTLYRWEKRWNKFEDIRYLVSRVKAKGPQDHRTHPEVVDLIERILDRHIYGGEERNDEYLYADFLLELDELNKFRDEDDKLPDISNATFRRRKQELLDQRRLNRARYGSHLAKLMDEGVKQEIAVSRPLQRVELDWTPVDVFLLDHGTMKAKRGNLIYAIDAFGSMPLGFKLTMNAPTVSDIKECLFHCMRPKTYVKEMFPRVEHDWIAYGKPRTLVVDNATVNDSRELEDICNHLGIRLLFAKVGAGNQKGTIERGFRTLNQKWIHAVDGTTKSNVIQRARYDSEGKACITPQTFIYMAHITMIDMVAHAFNRTLGNTPHAKWLEGWKANPHLRNPLPVSFDELQFLLVTGHGTRTIQNTGVEVLGEHYTSPELMQLNTRFKKERVEAKVKVRFNTSDMRSVHVFDPYEQRFLECFPLGLSRKGLDASLPVPDFALQQFMDEATANRKKVDPRARGRAQRANEALIQEDKKNKTAAKRGSRKVQEETAQTETNVLPTPTVPISVQSRQWDIPTDSHTIGRIFEDDSSNTAKKQADVSNEEKSTSDQSAISYSYDLSDDELEDMDVSFK